MPRSKWTVVDCEPLGVGVKIAPGTALPVLWQGDSEEGAVAFLKTLPLSDVEAGRYGIDEPV